MPFAVIDGITTRYEVVGSGPPLLMYSPGGFDATLEKWSTLGVYAKINLMDQLTRKHRCIVFDRRETGQSGGRVEHVTWAHYVAQGKGLLEHLKIERAHLMGGCMGCCPVAAFPDGIRPTPPRQRGISKSACRGRNTGTLPRRVRPKLPLRCACCSFSTA